MRCAQYAKFGCTGNRNSLCKSLFFPLKNFAILALLAALTGCSSMMHSYYESTLADKSGKIVQEELNSNASIARDDMGIPFIKAENPRDLAFACGYADARDRLSQMVSMNLMAEGRLSEMVGPIALDLDIYMRTMNLNKLTDLMYQAASPRMKRLIEKYCKGVNAYLQRHRDNLPPNLQLSGHKPDKWEPRDSISIFALINLGLAVNMHQEINTLSLLNKVSVSELPWLLPVYPDEGLPFEEAEKLRGLDFNSSQKNLAKMEQIHNKLFSMGIKTAAASNNWAVAPEKTANNATIFANDTHLPISLPSIWNMKHMRCPQYDAAGLSMAGLPAIIAGYNGDIAWGMTMTLGDNQDVFLERLRKQQGELQYLYKGKWRTAKSRTEVFRIKGKDPVKKRIYATRHGPLLNLALQDAKSMGQEFLPTSMEDSYGLAVKWAVFEQDKTLESFLELGRASSVKQARKRVKRIRTIPLNLVVADKKHISWQVTGRYPLRKNGTGLVPSPGWSGEYDWQGYLDVADHPSSLDPEKGFLGTANNRNIPADYPHTISNSWYYPERNQRLEQILKSSDKHKFLDSKNMQYDRYSRFVPKLQDTILQGELGRKIEEKIRSWDDREKRQKARKALDMLGSCEGHLYKNSTDCSVLGALYTTSNQNIFLDELGPGDSSSWEALLQNWSMCYSPQADHLIVRGEKSPFWDDANTPREEDKAEILADSLADATALLEEKFGTSDRSKWQWGDLHTYHFQTRASQMSEQMGWFKRSMFSLFSGYFDRGPYPAGGDHTTLNAATYKLEDDFDVWMIPVSRLIVDFSREIPLAGVNSSGQSGNPSSPHYADGTRAWLQGNYIQFPFEVSRIKDKYTNKLVLVP